VPDRKPPISQPAPDTTSQTAIRWKLRNSPAHREQHEQGPAQLHEHVR